MKERFTPVDGGKQRDDGLVEQLLELADPGPEIPADGARQIKNAIRPDWERGVRTRRWRRRSVVGLGVAAGLALFMVALRVIVPWGGAESPVQVAVIEVLVGTVEIEPAGTAEPRPIRIGEEMEGGSWLRTSAGGGAALRLGGGESLRLGGGATVRIDTISRIALERGPLYVDSPVGTRGGIEIETSLGVVREIGTQFEVRSDPEGLTVRVREGQVKIATGEEVLDLVAGSGISLSADGRSSETTIGAGDAVWDWAIELAPPFDLEGANAVAFLEWVSRETGLIIEYSSPEVASFAGGATLHGSLTGLDPDEASEVVLPSCGLRAVRSADRLVIHYALE